MSDTCCGITYVKGESFCIKCGKPLGNYTDSAFVPEKDITDCPTVIIDMAQIAEELRGKNDDSEMETVALRQEEDKLDSAFEDVLNAPAGENAVIEQPVQPANPNQKAGMQPGPQLPAVQPRQNRPVNHPAAPVQRPVAVKRNENDIREKKENDKSVGMLVACIIVIAITVFGLGAILLFTYKYKISPDYNQYSGEAAAGVLEYNIPEDDAENGGGN